MKQHWKTWNTPSFETQMENIGNQESLVPPHMLVLLRNGQVLDRINYCNWLGICNYKMEVVAYCYKMTRRTPSNKDNSILRLSEDREEYIAASKALDQIMEWNMELSLMSQRKSYEDWKRSKGLCSHITK